MAANTKINRNKFLAASALTLVTALVASPGIAKADDDHAWVFQNGGGSFSTDVSMPNTTTITQTTDRAIGIGNTSIAGNQTVNILQNGAGSLFVAKDNTGNASAILGRLNANGGVIVLNENGVIFGKDAVINVGSIVASTGQIDDAKFMTGDSKLELTNFGAGEIVNNGTINVSGAGLAALVAPGVVNNGIIQAKLGKVALASGGEKATVDLYGDGLIELTLGDSKAAAKIENTGSIEGKTVLMTAAAAKDVVDTVINMSGVVKASSVTEAGGKIILNGGGSGKVVVSGTVEASGATKGGSVNVKGNDVYVTGTIHADGGLFGGDVTIWGDKRTYFTGLISALGSNGFVETSGGMLGVHGSVNLSQGGEWLLDPTDLWIMPGTADGGPIPTDPNSYFSPDDSAPPAPSGDSWYWVGVDSINAALSNGNSVTLATHNNGDRQGDIQVNANILKSGGGEATLKLLAHHNIDINNSITSTSDKLNVFLFSDYDASGGDSNVNYNASILTNGGNITGLASNTQNIASGVVLDAQGGNVKLQQAGAFTNVDNNSVRTSGTGTIEIAQNVGGLIQSAVNAIQNTGTGTSTINLGAGTFVEQADIAKDLQLKGKGMGVTTIAAPALLAHSYNVNGTANKAVVMARDTNNVLLSGITVDGLNNGDANYKFSGIGYFNAGGSVQFSEVKNIGSNTFNGAQSGNGIYAYNLDNQERYFNVIGTSVHDFQKNGITVSGAGLNSVIGGNTITGLGAVNFIAQNGIQVSYGANATVNNNAISGFGYIPSSWSASSVLVYQGGNDVNIKDNIITGTGYDAGISVYATNGAEITGNKVTGSADGIDIDSSNGVTVSGNTVKNSVADGIWISGGNGATIKNNTVTNSGDDGIDIDGTLGVVSVKGNTIDGTRGGHESNGLAISGANGVTVDGNTIKNTDWNNINVVGASGTVIKNNTLQNSRNASGIGIWQGSDNTTIDANSITGSNYGIWNQGGNLEIGRNTISGNGANGVYLLDTLGANVHNNFIHNNPNAGLIADGSTNNVTVYDNSFNANGKNIINATGNMVNASFNWWGSNTAAAVAAGNTGSVDFSPFQDIGVDQDLAQAGYQGSAGNQHVTNLGAQQSGLIQEGVNAAAANGTLNIDGGDYTENVNLNKAGLKLNGNGATVHYDAANAGINSTTVGSIFTITANNVNVDPFTFDGGNVASYGITVTGSGDIVDGNEFKNFTQAGIYLLGATNAQVINNNVHDNAMYGILANGATGSLIKDNTVNNSSWDAIRIVGGTNTDIVHNTLTNSGTAQGVNGVGSGIVLVQADDVLVDDNDITNAARIGVYAGGSSNVTINNNRLSNIGTGTNTAVGDSIGQWAGVHVEGTKNVAVTSNTINGTTGEGINLGGFINTGLNGGDTGTVTVSGNTINNTGKDGISVANATGTIKILGNQVGLLGAANSIGGNAGGGDAIFVTNSDGTIIQSNKTANTNYNGPLRKGSGILVTNSDNVKIGGAGALGNDVALAGSDGIVVRTDGGTADHNTIEGNVVHGVAGSRTGIYTENATNTVIKDNTVSGTGRYAAIYGYGGSDFGITGNTLNHNDEEGILLQNAGGTNNISGNTIDNTGENLKTSDGTNVGDAIHVEGTSGLTISGNFIGTNGGNIRGDGVYVTGSNGVVVKGNTINDTKFTTADVNGSNGSGIQVVGTNGATIGGAGTDHNTITNTQWDGIRLQNDSNVTVSNNAINNTGRVNIWGGNINTASILDNIVNNDNLGGYGSIHADGGSSWTVSGNNVDHADYGIFLNGVGGTNAVSGNTIGNMDLVTTTITADGIRVIGSSNLTVLGNIIGNGVTIGADGIHVENSTGAKILNNYAYNTFGAGVFVKDSDNANVTANDVESGHAIAGINVVNSDNVQIKTNAVGSNFPGIFPGNGIVVQGGSDNAIVSGNTVNVKSTGNGILIDGGNSQTVSGNTVNGGNRGILLNGTGNGATVSGNTVGQTTGSGNNGIELSNTGTATVSGNHVYNAGWDGINVNGGNVFITVSGNDVHNSLGASGIVFYAHNGGGLIENNIVENSARLGIYDGFSNDVIIRGNTVTNSGTANIGNFTDGIFVEQANTVTIDNNKINTAKGNGIRVGGLGNAAAAATTGIVVKNNKVANTGTNGIALQDSGTASITGNKVGYLADGKTAASTGNIKGDGIHVENAASVVISGNGVINTVGNGIFVDPSNAAQLFSNAITNVGGNGIWSLNNDDANIYSNIITGAGLDGILVQGGNGVNIGGNGTNTITNSGDDGIDVENTTGTVIVKNNKIDYTGLNSASDEDQNGIEVSGTENATIEANAVGHAAWDGINVQQSSGTTIKGNKIFNTLGASGIGVHNGVSNITIDDNVITTALQFGMWLGGVSGNLTVTNNDISGVKQADGIYVNNSTGVVKINKNDISNVGRHGINGAGNIDEVNENRINKTGTFQAGIGHGILVTDSALVQIKNNIVGGDITDSASTNRFRKLNASGAESKGNVTSGANNIADDGIHVENSASAEIRGNKVSNTVDDGIYLDPSDYSVIAGNTVTTTGGDGIESADNSHVTIGGTATTYGNTISGAGAHGINVHGGVSALIQNNTVKGGNAILSGLTITDGASGAKLDGIHVENNDGVEIIANTVTAGQGLTYTIPNYIPFIGGTTIGASGGNGANQNGIFVSNSNNAVIDQNMVLPDLLGNGIGAVADGIHVENSNNLTVGGLVPLVNGNKILSTGGDGIYINGSTGALVLNNVVTGAGLDLFGTTISGEIGGDGIEMKNTLGSLVAGNIITHVKGDGIRFSEGTLSGIGLNVIDNTGENGIEISNSGAVAVGLNQISHTILNGISLNGVLLAAVLNNNISKTGADGIHANLGAGLLISDNTIKTTGGDGIDAGFAAFVDVLNNNIDDTAGDGVRLFAVLNGNVNDNAISNTDGNGVNAALAYNLDVKGNTITHAGANGIAATFVANADIMNNMIVDVENDGVQVTAAINAAINGNTITNAGDDGIDAAFVYGLDIDGNTVDAVGANGIEASYVANANIANNNVGLNGYVVGNGIDLRNSANVTIVGNDVGANVWNNGIFIDPSSNITVNDNDVNGVGYDGIHAEDTTNLTITNNRIGDTGNNGVYVTGSRHVLVAENDVANAGWNGIEVDYATGGTKEDPTVVIRSNNVTDARNNGIEVNNVDSSLIDNNTVTFAAQSEEGPGDEEGPGGDEVEGTEFLRFAKIANAGNNGIVVKNSGVTTIIGNTVTNAPQGGIVVDNVMKSVVTSNVVTNSGANGFFAQGGYNRDVILAGNTFNDNKFGARFESGKIDMRGDANVFNGGDIGMQFDPFQFVNYVEGEGSEGEGQGEGFESASSENEGFYTYTPAELSLVDDTIGTTIFNNQTTFYVELKNGALFNPGTPTIIDGFHATYDGFRPDTVPFLTLAQYNAIESKIYHYRDDATLGLFFFGFLPGVDQKDLFREFAEFGGAAGKFRVTILGLPQIGGAARGSFSGGGNIANLLASITPAAGGNDTGKKSKTSPADLGDIEPAAGGITTPAASNNNDPSDTSCWGQAVSQASQGAAVDYSFGGSMEETIAQTASCGT